MKILNKKVSVKVDGATKRLPLAEAITRTSRKPGARKAVMAQLSMKERLIGFSEVETRDYAEDAEWMDAFFNLIDKPLLGRIGAEGKQWAPRFADELVKEKRPIYEITRWVVFLALVRSKIPIKPEWNTLLPLGWGAWGKLTVECVRAIPEERRATAIGQSLTPQDFEAGLFLLGHFPSADLTRKILDFADEGGASKSVTLKRVAALGAKDAVIKEALTRWKKGQPEGITLTCKKLLSFKRPSDLDAAQKKQLAAAARSYNGSNTEDVFEVDVKLCRLYDAAGKHIYDAYLFMADSGAIFAAGKTKIVASIIQDGIECEDAALGDGIEAAIAKYL